MTREEAVSAAQAQGLANPRIMPHKARDGMVSWNLFHGPNDDRKVIVVSANVSAAALKKAVEQANGQNSE